MRCGFAVRRVTVLCFHPFISIVIFQIVEASYYRRILALLFLLKVYCHHFGRIEKKFPLAMADIRRLSLPAHAHFSHFFRSLVPNPASK